MEDDRYGLRRGGRTIGDQFSKLSSETVQRRRFVVVQPYEEVAFQRPQGGSERRRGMSRAVPVDYAICFSRWALLARWMPGST